MTFAQRRNRLTTRFSEHIPDVKRRISVSYTYINNTLAHAHTHTHHHHHHNHNTALNHILCYTADNASPYLISADILKSTLLFTGVYLYFIQKFIVIKKDFTAQSIKQDVKRVFFYVYRGADKSLARPTCRYILFDGENISFDVSLLIYIYIYVYIYIYISSTDIPPIMIINRIYETQNLLSL